MFNHLTQKNYMKKTIKKSTQLDNIMSFIWAIGIIGG